MKCDTWNRKGLRDRDSQSFAGQPASGLDANDGEGGRKGGIPTWALVAGGVVVMLGVAGAVFLDYLGDQSE